MSETTTTAKVPATHSGKVCAQGRSGMVNARNGYFKSGKGFAVDVIANGSGASSHYTKGVIVRFFNSRDEATAFAASVAAGTAGAWYTSRNARNAKVVAAYNVPVGKSAVDVLADAAKAAAKPAAKPAAPALPAAS